MADNCGNIDLPGAGEARRHQDRCPNVPDDCLDLGILNHCAGIRDAQHVSGLVSEIDRILPPCHYASAIPLKAGLFQFKVVTYST